jgi:cysteine-rich repeat protein
MACGRDSDGVDVESNSFALLTDPSLVKPVLECVTQEGATNFTAYFGYSNTSTDSVSVPVGTNNKFTPGTNLGQPTLFIPGRQRSVFSVQFNGSNLVWKLGPRTSTASSTSKRCVFPDAGVDASVDATVDAPPDPCSNPVGLDDGNPCTTDTCTAALGVQHQPVGNGVSCSNGNACDGTETCFSGVCSPGTPPGLDDGNPCTADSCTPATGPTHTPAADGTLCLNSSLCDGTEACLAGVCTPGTSPIVNDDNPCTTDSCDPITGVQHLPVPELTGCPNATLCDGTETCVTGLCQSGTPPVVDDGNPCTIDTCDASLGVAHTPAPDGTSCSDGNACTLADSCQNGSCSASQSVSCPLPPGCSTQGVCDPSTGVCSGASGCVVCGSGSLDPGEQCDDGNTLSGDGCSATCTVERCNGVVCPGASDPCMQNTCSPTTGQCVLSPKANGVTCDDNRLCTTGDQCQDGSCSGAAIDCGGGSATDCGSATFCQETTGVCVTGPAPNDTPCNDGDLCTTDDACLAGACKGALSVACFAETVTQIDPTVPTLMGPSTAFIYTGPDAVQRGMESQTIDFRIASVLRGRVRTRDGVPVGAVNVQVMGHPEFGTTRSREDGYFDMVVNGGVEHLLRFERPGLLRVDRPMKTYWGEYSVLPDVVMTALDNRMTPVGFPTTAATVVTGSPVTDEDGTRTISLFFNPGTYATIGTANVPMLSIRSTEFTVGPDGPNAMPMPLPANSAYTYAFALTADEVNEDTTINFSQPAALYVENFLHFPNGIPLAVGLSRPDIGAWCADPNGRVVTVVGIENGYAVLEPEVTESAAELRFVASRYQVGQSLWRVPIDHFSTRDINPPFGLRKGRAFPRVSQPQKRNENNRSPKPDETECGSIIGCETRSLGEQIGITGTPYHLIYSSGNASGDYRTRQFSITAEPLKDGAANTEEGTPDEPVADPKRPRKSVREKERAFI